jgi:hypothetical protein
MVPLRVPFSEASVGRLELLVVLPVARSLEVVRALLPELLSRRHQLPLMGAQAPHSMASLMDFTEAYSVGSNMGLTRFVVSKMVFENMNRIVLVALFFAASMGALLGVHTAAMIGLGDIPGRVSALIFAIPLAFVAAISGDRSSIYDSVYITKHRVAAIALSFVLSLLVTSVFDCGYVALLKG